ncbi:MAG: RNA 2'-phosphotransferase [Aquabacterium sp.]|jgi:putative RNA 2'-phosphotransferase|nr:MAG: RNA 2'-phosphotransferase [Aquabacterium sp.]
MKENKDKLVSASKFLSLVLRHEPQRLGLQPDAAGWVAISTLLEKLAAAGRPLSPQALRELVASSDKQRFALSEDGLCIRANQGHSIEVDLALPPAQPPARLYHGTATRFLPTILEEGLRRMARHHVHLSQDLDVALNVGARHGTPAILMVAAARMHADGHRFFRSGNGVWLVEAVPPAYLSRQQEGENKT